MKKMLFIMNPYSGMRRAVRYLADIIAMFNRADYEMLTYMTGGHGDAQEIARNRAADADLVVCVVVVVSSSVFPPQPAKQVRTITKLSNNNTIFFIFLCLL